MNNDYQICINCVMDTSDSKIRFNEDGLCDHCQTYYKDIKPNWNTDERGWKKICIQAEHIKKIGKGKDFDCIIGLSGGLDSSYLVYLAKEKLGLRPLVFHVDAGWNSQQAVHNIEAIVNKLNLDLYTEVINWEEMKDLQLAYFKSGVPTIDTPQDHSFFSIMYKFAKTNNIRYILTGGNYSTECIRNPIEWMYYQSDSTQLKDIHQKFGTIPLKSFPTTNILHHKVYLPYIKRIKLIRPLDFMPYNKTEATQFLVREFGYQQYAQKHFESIFTRFYESYWLPKKFGYDTRRVQYSSLILTNQMIRDDALEKLKTFVISDEDLKRDFDYVSKKLGITSDELQMFMDSPNKTFRDYKNQMWLYDLGVRVLRAIGIERGGKR